MVLWNIFLPWKLKKLNFAEVFNVLVVIVHYCLSKALQRYVTWYVVQCSGYRKFAFRWYIYIYIHIYTYIYIYIHTHTHTHTQRFYCIGICHWHLVWTMAFTGKFVYIRKNCRDLYTLYKAHWKSEVIIFSFICSRFSFYSNAENFFHSLNSFFFKNAAYVLLVFFSQVPFSFLIYENLF